MTKTELVAMLMNVEGAVMARANKTNFIAVPTDEGIQKINVTTALAQDTKNHKAFNLDAAVAEYKAYEAETALKAAEKATKPVKVKGPNPEAQARRDAMDKAIAELPSFTEYTATDITRALESVGFLPENSMPMQVGQSAKRLATAGVLTLTMKGEGAKAKAYYTKG